MQFLSYAQSLKYISYICRYSYYITVNYYHKALHLGCCSSPRSASALDNSSSLQFENAFENEAKRHSAEKKMSKS